METPQSSHSVDDRPTATDRLEFDPYVRALTNLIAADGTGTPLTVGVFGPWGSGKTSLMMMMQARLTKHTTVWFDAWKYEREDALWRALIVQVLAHLRREAIDGTSGKRTQAQQEADQALDDLEASLYRVVEREEAGELRIDWGELGKGAGKAALHLAFSAVPVVGTLLPKLMEKGQQLAGEELGTLFDAVKRERQRIYREHVRSVEQFQQRFEQLVAERITDNGRRLIVFVDDLDRCLPEKAVEVLEAIKLFMDVPGCIFVLGLDRNVIARGIEIRYREMKLLGGGADEAQRFAIEGRRYLEKIIQIPFKLPPVDPGVMQTYVDSLVGEWPDPACSQVFAAGTGETPRGIKRMVNTFLLLWEIKKARGLTGITPVRLAKVVALQHLSPPGLYDELEKVPRLLRDLEAYYRQEATLGRAERGEASPEASPTEAPKAVTPLPPVLERFASRAVLRRLLTLHTVETADANFVVMDGDEVVGLKPEELQPYFTLAQQVVASSEPTPEGLTTVPFPQTVPIPEGPFKMGTTPDEAKVAKDLGARENWLKREAPQHDVMLSAYEIGKYPVTNREYQAFVQDSDHPPPEHWDGNEYPAEKGGHPVVYVSWDDATAYCTWLTEKSPNDKIYSLPTEAQWEKAARGTDARVFPWGNTWDPERCNAGGRLGDTTPVGAYAPAGDSPYEVVDMAGNVWEWCSDYYDKATYQDRDGKTVTDPTGPPLGNSRVMRGGAFFNGDNLVRCAARSRNFPNYRSNGIGFRVIVRPPLNAEASDR